MKVMFQILTVAVLYILTSALPTPQFFVPPAHQQRNRPRPLRPVGGILSGLFNNGQQPPVIPPAPAVPGHDAAHLHGGVSPGGVPHPAPIPEAGTPVGDVVPAPNAALGAFPKQPGSLFTEGAPTGSANPNGNIGSLLGMLNGGQFGSATAGGAGSGGVQNHTAVGQGTGVANAGQGGFGIGLGIGGAIATPLGDLAFGQGDSIAVGK